MGSHLPRPRWLVIAELFQPDFTPPQPNLKGSPIPIGRPPRIVNSEITVQGLHLARGLGLLHILAAGS